MLRRPALLALTVLATACTAWPGLVAPPEEEAPPEPESYVALGDSLATGAGAQTGYAERYARLLDGQTHSRLRFANLAYDGWTSSDLLGALREDPRFSDALGDADVVTINIGGNDLLGAHGQVLAGDCEGDACLHDAVATFAENWDAIVVEVDNRVSDDTRIVAMDIYNPFVSTMRALGVLDRLQPFLDAVNDHIARSAAERGIAFAPVFATFNGDDGTDDPAAEGLIADDLLHPSDEGHAVIAEVLVQASRRS